MILVASEDWIRSKAKTAFKTLCRQCLGDPDDTTLQEIAVRAREIALEEYRDLVVEPVSEMRKKFLVEEADKWIQNETLSRASNVSARVERAASNATLPPRMFRHSSLGGDSIHSLSSRLESEPPLRRSFSSPRGSSVAPELLLSPTSTHPPSRKRAREIENTSSFLEYATSAKRNKRYEREETVDTVITNRRNRSPSTSRPQSSDGPAKVKVRCPFQDHPRLMSTGTHKCNGKYAGLSNLRSVPFTHDITVPIPLSPALLPPSLLPSLALSQFSLLLLSSSLHHRLASTSSLPFIFSYLTTLRIPPQFSSAIISPVS